MEAPKCQLCSQNTHEADICPYQCTPCKYPSCNGFRKLLICKSTINLNRKYLKCQAPHCPHVQWLDEAVLERAGYVTSTSSNTGCFTCGRVDHWMQDCPFKPIPCLKEGCDGNISMKTCKSSSSGNEGKKYLKCSKCNYYKWLGALTIIEPASPATPTPIASPATPSTPIPANVTATVEIERELNKMCIKFSNNIVFK